MLDRQDLRDGKLEDRAQSKTRARKYEAVLCCMNIFAVQFFEVVNAASGKGFGCYEFHKVESKSDRHALYPDFISIAASSSLRSTCFDNPFAYDVEVIS